MMIDVGNIAGPSSAFVAGLVTSLHCIGMCGPMACFLAPAKGGQSSFVVTAACYQSSRLLSYTLAGALAGWLGMLSLQWVQGYQNSLARFLPWALVLFFLLVALRMDRWIPKPQWLQKYLFRAQLKVRSWPRPASASAFGLLTPLLPCAPLYAVFSLALMTQSPVRGAEFLLAFGCGTLPLLWLAQSQYVRLQQRVSPVWISRMQRGLALVAAIVIGFRLYLFETSEAGFFCDF